MRIFITALLSFSLLALSAQTMAESNSPAANTFKLKPVAELQDPPSDRFPGDPAEHKAVYMWNKSDPAYQHSILNSIQAMIKRYGDNVDIAVVAIGPGLGMHDWGRSQFERTREVPQPLVVDADALNWLSQLGGRRLVPPTHGDAAPSRMVRQRRQVHRVRPPRGADHSHPDHRSVRPGVRAACSDTALVRTLISRRRRRRGR